jgi:hypothetical protein
MSTLDMALASASHAMFKAQHNEEGGEDRGQGPWMGERMRSHRPRTKARRCATGLCSSLPAQSRPPPVRSPVGETPGRLPGCVSCPSLPYPLPGGPGGPRQTRFRPFGKPNLGGLHRAAGLAPVRTAQQGLVVEPCAGVVLAAGRRRRVSNAAIRPLSQPTGSGGGVSMPLLAARAALSVRRKGTARPASDTGDAPARGTPLGPGVYTVVQKLTADPF